MILLNGGCMTTAERLRVSMYSMDDRVGVYDGE